MELLRDPLWQFVGAILAIAAIAVTIVVYLLQRNRKSLSYEIVSNNSLLTVREELEGKVKITYEDTPVKNVQLIVMKIINTGNVPITPSDFVRPLQFIFDEQTRILSSEVTKKEPKNIDAHITIDKNSFRLEPTLLNGKDSITIKSLVYDFDGLPKVDTRIIGVDRVIPITEMSIRSVALVLIGFLLGLSGMVITLKPLNSSKLVEEPLGNEVHGFYFLMLGYILLVIGALSSRKYREIMRKILIPKRKGTD